MKHVGYNFVCTVEHSDLFSVCFTERIHFSSPIYATVPPKTDPLVWSGLVYLVICLLHGSSFFFFLRHCGIVWLLRMRSWSVWCNRQRQECWSTAYTELQHMSSLTDARSALSAVALWQYLHPLFIIPNKNWIICGYLCNSFRLLYDLTFIALGEVCIRFLC